MYKIILLSVLLCFQATSFSMIAPYYKEVLERGYQLMPGDSVMFPDGSSCKIIDFNTGTCGQKWMTTDYCVKEGVAVWNKDRCCEGLEPYLSPDTDGQATCQATASSWLGNETILYFFLGVLIPLGLFVILAFGIKRKMKQQNVRN